MKKRINKIVLTGLISATTLVSSGNLAGAQEQQIEKNIKKGIQNGKVKLVFFGIKFIKLNMFPNCLR